MDQEHVYGNFASYYEFHTASERINILSKYAIVQRLFQYTARDSISILDIGCNDGSLTKAIVDWVQNPLSMKATSKTNHIHDTDNSMSSLNDLAQKHKWQIHFHTQETCNNHRLDRFEANVYLNQVYFGSGRAASLKQAKKFAALQALQRISAPVQSTLRPEKHMAIAPKCGKVHMTGIDIDDKLIQKAILRNALENIKYLTMDVVVDKKQLNTKYDMICCFSTTMWIHLNHGDAGLYSLLEWISTSTDCFILEPQPWKCYRNAYTRLKRMGQAPKYAIKDTQILDKIQKYIVDTQQFKHHKVLGVTKWGRKIHLFANFAI